MEVDLHKYCQEVLALIERPLTIIGIEIGHYDQFGRVIYSSPYDPTHKAIFIVYTEDGAIETDGENSFATHYSDYPPDSPYYQMRMLACVKPMFRTRHNNGKKETNLTINHKEIIRKRIKQFVECTLGS